ncbi:MAG: hypothetical protein ACLFT8_00355 [Desulfovermiculus sp.]
MGLDLRELNIPQGFLALYQAGISYLLPAGDIREPSRQDTRAVKEEDPAQEVHPDQGFPPPWSQVWKKLRPPYTMVWTYWQLSEDLGPAPCLERQQLFKAILSQLRWPRGSVAFWPLSAFDGQTHTAHLDLFWSGIQALQAELVVIFGTQAFQTLFPDKGPGLGFSSTRDGLQIVHVPGPEDMLPNNRDMKNLTWNMLCPLSPLQSNRLQGGPSGSGPGGPVPGA